MKICDEFPCPKCGHFRGEGGVVCLECGRDPGETSFCQLTMGTPETNYSFYRILLNALIATPAMVFIGYPVGRIVLCVFSFGRLRLGPWDNRGKSYEMSIDRVFGFSTSQNETFDLSTESVAAIGWNLSVLLVVGLVWCRYCN